MTASSSASGSRCWLSSYPRLLAEWHPERNGALTPDCIAAGSGQTVWWRCPVATDHVWRAKPDNRTRGSGCPFCANRRVSSSNSLARCFPAIAAEWHPRRNGLTSPHGVVATSTRIAWWLCGNVPEHAWRATIRDRTRGQSSCPWCTQRRVPGDASLARCHPALAAEWHPERNGGLLPDHVAPGSSRSVWWRCASNATHVWRASVASRVHRASACPSCAASPRA